MTSHLITRTIPPQVAGGEGSSAASHFHCVWFAQPLSGPKLETVKLPQICSSVERLR